MCAIAKLIWHEYIFTAIFFDLLSSADFEFVMLFFYNTCCDSCGWSRRASPPSLHSFVRFVIKGGRVFCVRKSLNNFCSVCFLFQIFHNHVLIAMKAFFSSLKCAINGSLNLQRCGSLTVEHIEYSLFAIAILKWISPFGGKKFDYIISKWQKHRKKSSRESTICLFVYLK